jgi:beta-lactam-binding protein with PASTA domain
LSEQGFKVSVSTKFSSSVNEGDVISQSPGAGNRIARGAKVTITVSKGEDKVAVPEIVFKTVDDAKELLNNEGLKLIVSSQKYNSTVPEGCIISQSPKAGKKVTKGTGIGVVVSLGKQPSTEDTTGDTEE